MTTAEKLARQIRRVAQLRGTFVDGLRVLQEAGVDLVVVDAALDHACRAMGTGDDVAMIAAGLVLEGIEA